MENLNFVDIFMLILLLVLVMDGCIKGFVLSIANFVRSIVGYILCFFASAKLTPIVYENYVKHLMYDKVSVKLGEIANLDQIVENIDATVAQLPAFLRDSVDLSKLDGVTQSNAVDFMMDSVVEPVANTVIKFLVFFIVFVLFFVITGVIISLIKKLRNADKSSLKTTDRIVGGVFGLAKFCVVALALASLVNMIAPYSTSTDGVIAMAKASSIFNFISQYNLFDMILGGVK